MESAILHWGDGKGNLICDGPLVKEHYLEFYENILPELCGRVAPDVFYWPSSPSNGGNFDDPDDPSRGDQHFWEVWNGEKPFTEYRKHIEKDAALERRFQPVTVGEPTEEQALAILRGLRDRYEAHHKVKIGEEALQAAVEL